MRDKRKVEEIDIVFENCEVVTLTIDRIECLAIERISKEYIINGYQYKAGEMEKRICCGELYLRINQKGLEQKVEWEDKELKERLKFRDITMIELHYDTQEREEIYVPWEDEGNFGTNKYQNNEMNNEGMEITIKEDK